MAQLWRDVAAALRFLFNAMAPKDEPGLAPKGIPAMLYLDNGPVVKVSVRGCGGNLAGSARRAAYPITGSPARA